jgi:His-Xaa-Ser system radical SAM maturase HxsB
VPNVVFYDREHFRLSRPEYRFLPFRFIDLDDRKVLVNDVGEYLILSQAAFEQFIEKKLPRTSDVYHDLKSHHFLWDSPSDVPIRLLATKYRTKRGFLAGFTKLHLFVVTLRCDHSCPYCQVSRVSTDRDAFDMSAHTARRALDLVFRSPADPLKIEFQGGEALLNWELVQFIVQEAEQRAKASNRDVEFVVATNVAFLDDSILEFMKAHKMLVSTSLDGPESLHNSNRPRRGNDSHARTIEGIERARRALGHDAVSALMTTTRLSLSQPEAIVDEYVAQGFQSIFLRPISPYGFAVRSQQVTGYTRHEFVTFYKRALAHILDINRAGTFFAEIYSRLLLRKMLTPYSTGYVDLQSPAGAGIAVAVYNYDGDVYATDESRMLAEMGDTTFRLGNVHKNSYEELFGGDLIRSLVASSCVEALPACAECAFNPYCGCDPVENHATQGSIWGHRPTSAFCERNMEAIKHLLRLYESGDPIMRKIFWSWIENAPTSHLAPTFGAES